MNVPPLSRDTAVSLQEKCNVHALSHAVQMGSELHDFI